MVWVFTVTDFEQMILDHGTYKIDLFISMRGRRTLQQHISKLELCPWLFYFSFTKILCYTKSMGFPLKFRRFLPISKNHFLSFRNKIFFFLKNFLPKIFRLYFLFKWLKKIHIVQKVLVVKSIKKAVKMTVAWFNLQITKVKLFSSLLLNFTII